jgi:hypothetical protein
MLCARKADIAISSASAKGIRSSQGLLSRLKGVFTVGTTHSRNTHPDGTIIFSLMGQAKALAMFVAASV